jgi:N-acylglucosamine 2-epimerase
MTLAGQTLVELRERYRKELFEVVLPFWDAHGIDHEHGGFLCGLDYDGARVNDDKFHWFQGRGIWVYSFLYNQFGGNPEHLEVARRAKDFLLEKAPQQDGWWAELLSRDGTVLRPFHGDIYGMYFAAEGLQEYAAAAADEKALETALALVKKLFRHITTERPRVRGQGLWMVNLRVASQFLARSRDPEIAAIADQSVEAIINKHYNPDIGLNNEVLNFDFGRAEGEESKCVIGHSIESLWMVMDEARRRSDSALIDVCMQRIRRHLDVGWDRVYGGLAHAVNVDHGGYEWPPERPVGTDFEFRSVGEYHYMKSLWSLNEALIATLNVFERTGADWAAEYFSMAHRTMEEKFSMRKHGLPGYMLFADRRMARRPHAQRQDNYHPPRQLMLNILALERMLSMNASR